MDGLNFAKNFYDPNGLHWIEISKLNQSIIEFTDACKHSNISLWVFIDSSKKSDESLEVWKKRRVDELIE